MAREANQGGDREDNRTETRITEQRAEAKESEAKLGRSRADTKDPVQHARGTGTGRFVQQRQAETTYECIDNFAFIEPRAGTCRRERGIKPDMTKGHQSERRFLTDLVSTDIGKRTNEKGRQDIQGLANLQARGGGKKQRDICV